MTAATVTDNDTPFGDMNGPLAYWGPVAAPPSLPVRRARRMTERPLPTDQAALTRLSRTMHGRTWSGTNALMSTLFAAAPQPAHART